MSGDLATNSTSLHFHLPKFGLSGKTPRDAQEDCSSNMNTNQLWILQNADSQAVGLGWGPRDCISIKSRSMLLVCMDHTLRSKDL